MPVAPLPPEALRRRCDPDELPFATTEELPDLDELPGQERAFDAARFGIGIRRPGYNLFALGGPGAGNHAMVGAFVQRRAAGEPTPPDLAYVYNFDDPQRPVALQLPAGMAATLRTDMAELVDDLKNAVPGLFESADYRSRRQVIEEEFKQRQAAALEALQDRGKPKNLALIRTSTGFAFAPVRDGGVINPEQFLQLPAEEQERVRADIEALQQALAETVGQLPLWERERRQKVRDLNRQVTVFAVGHVIDLLRQKLSAQAGVVQYLAAVEHDVVEHVDEFLGSSERQGQAPEGPVPTPAQDADRFRRYKVNVLVDNAGQTGAPVIYEDNPTQANLVGIVGQIAEMGAVIADFTLIKAGALHRANGGYLVIDAHRVLQHPYAWEALKRALRSREIRIESPGQMLNMITIITLEPQAVPMNLKVILVGERWLYYQLSQNDFEFHELFKVAVDFEDDMAWDSETAIAYSQLIATIVRREGLRPLDRTGVARTIEHGARLADDATRLSMRIANLADILREADYWAAQSTHATIGATDIQQAIDARHRRNDRVRERSLEMIERGLVLIDTDGSRSGQINGLSVLTLGALTFGKPNRITARVRLGRGEVIDIERQVELGGPIHSKGVLILAAFLGGRYAVEHPLSLSASLVFEQSYSGVDGDSASSAELYALLSALAEVPIDQSFAVTGSVNQHGQVQVIGGVNEKIEGFFDLCDARGLTGRQGVLIPAGNVEHLMLRHDVVAAAKAGKFRILPVRTIDEGIELLTGIAAGERGGDGQFLAGSINRRVEDRLIALADQRRRFVVLAGDGGA